MSLQVETFALELIGELRPLIPRIRRHDRSLAVQLVRAADSIGLNIGEAAYSDPGNRRARFFTAAASANETRMALRVALAWGYLSDVQAKAPLARLDRIVAILWTLSR